MISRSVSLSGHRATRTSHFEHVLGTALDITWVGRGLFGRFLLPRVESAVLREIARLEEILSTWRVDSEVSRWEATFDDPNPVSPELAEVLELAEAWRMRTGGAFDPSPYGPSALVQRWRVNRGCTSSESVVTATRLARHSLTLDAIAKGYIVDRACVRGFRANRGEDVLVNSGGDIRHMGERGATVGITDPFADAENARPLDVIRLRDEGLATSGGWRRPVRIDGSSYSHIMDPRTGAPASHVTGASVLAPSATTADVLATAFCVLEPDRSLSLADATPGVGCHLVLPTGETISNALWRERRIRRAPAIPRREVLRRALGGGIFVGGVGNARSKARSTPKGGSRRTGVSRVQWDESLELEIQFDFGDPRGGMAVRRPYVVVYIDLEDGTPVRTMGLWAQRAQWIRELRRWYRAERAREAERGGSLIDTLTAPTRPAGHYTVLWDGRDDEGEWVEQGEYFVCLETIRQGSSSYFARQPFTFEASPFQARMDDYGGFRDIQLDFRQRA